jgi:hypothetical protein|uniref:Uncharacterized protein n=1 Tax=Desulfobacca acetoxidans TaxID=60893 RepID=A0A7C3ZC36_9BACT
MKGPSRLKIDPIIIRQNAREEFHLTLTQYDSGTYVDLRTCIRNPNTGKASPTGQGIMINLELWSYFSAAVTSPETWTEPVPFWSQEKSPNSGKGRLIFPEEVLRQKPQEQIFLEHQNFQGIPFIFFKTLARTTRGRRLALTTVGPLLWSQFVRSLRKMEEKLADLGRPTARTGRIRERRNFAKKNAHL